MPSSDFQPLLRETKQLRADVDMHVELGLPGNPKTLRPMTAHGKRPSRIPVPRSASASSPTWLKFFAGMVFGSALTLLSGKHFVSQSLAAHGAWSGHGISKRSAPTAAVLDIGSGMGGISKDAIFQEAGVYGVPGIVVDSRSRPGYIVSYNRMTRNANYVSLGHFTKGTDVVQGP